MRVLENMSVFPPDSKVFGVLFTFMCIIKPSIGPCLVTRINIYNLLIKYIHGFI